ncbi:hypothetical protein CsatA_020561 [Cannabis sativa]
MVIEPLLSFIVPVSILLTTPRSSSILIEIKFLAKLGTNLTPVRVLTIPSYILKLTLPEPSIWHVWLLPKMTFPPLDSLKSESKDLLLVM